MSVEEILRPIIEQEFARYEQNGYKIKLPSVTRDRIKYTICCLLGAFFFFPIALIVYIVLMSGTSNVKTIIRLAKKSPDKPIEQIISEEMNSKGSIGAVIGMIAVIGCALMFFVSGLNMVVDMFDSANAIMSELSGDESDEEQNLEVERSEENTYVAYGEGYKLVSAGLQYMDEEHVVIPSQYEGLDVVAIGAKAFSDFTNLKSIEIPDTVIAIEGECFKNCYSLERIEIPTGVTEIRGNCFENCYDLTEVILHDDIVAIHGYAFRNCDSLEEIKLPLGIRK